MMVQSTRFAGAKVLVLDDQPMEARMMSVLLRDQGYYVACHTSPSEAILALNEGDFDVVVVDLRMPEISGLEFLSVAQQAGGASVFFIITAEGDIDTAVAALKAGARDYLVKPFDVVRTVTVIDQALEQRNRDRAQQQRDRKTAAEVGNLNQQLLLDKRAAELASKAKTEFISGLSHELRNSLNPIIGFSRILMNLKWDLGKNERERFLANIYASAKLMQRLLEDAGNIARIEASQVDIRKENVALPMIVTECVSIFEQEFSEKGINVLNRVENLHVHVDPNRLRQVLTNLVSNAIKYNRQGGDVEIFTRQFADQVELVVRDSGIGMSAEQLDRLFTPFDRLGMEHSGIGGVGLGLVLARKLTDLMGGGLNVSSSVGMGTEVCIVLPVAQEGMTFRGGEEKYA